MTSGLAEPGRKVAASLAFAVGGGRTMLSRQHVPYPFHVTRPFRLDAARPDIATLYLQSASGGLYRGDDLGLQIAVADGAAAHLVTQSATVVHDTGSQPARLRVDATLGEGAFLAYTPDPLILFPNAAIRNETSVTLAPDACAIIGDAFTTHDPAMPRTGPGARPFAAIIQRLTVRTSAGRLLLCETGRLRGQDAFASTSPLGAFGAVGALVVLASRERLPAPDVLQRAADGKAGLTGVTALPNGAGLLLRCLARDGAAVRRSLDAAFEVAFASLTGIRPSPRRR